MMNKENLKDSLKKLHTNLGAADQIDDELKDLLQVLDKDIQNLLAKEEHDESIADALGERVQEISATFAARHPKLEPILRDIRDMLARLGV